MTLLCIDTFPKTLILIDFTWRKTRINILGVGSLLISRISNTVTNTGKSWRFQRSQFSCTRLIWIRGKIPFKLIQYKNSFSTELCFQLLESWLLWEWRKSRKGNKNEFILIRSSWQRKISNLIFSSCQNLSLYCKVWFEDNSDPVIANITGDFRLK